MEIKEYFEKQERICDYLLEKRRDKNTQYNTLKYHGFSFWEASLILDTHDEFIHKKKCSKCGEEKVLRCFNKVHKSKSNRLRGVCNVCRKKHNKYNSESNKRYEEKNKKKRSYQKSKIYYKKKLND